MIFVECEKWEWINQNPGEFFSVMMMMRTDLFSFLFFYIFIWTYIHIQQINGGARDESKGDPKSVDAQKWMRWVVEEATYYTEDEGCTAWRSNWGLLDCIYTAMWCGLLCIHTHTHTHNIYHPLPPHKLILFTPYLFFCLKIIFFLLFLFLSLSFFLRTV